MFDAYTLLVEKGWSTSQYQGRGPVPEIGERRKLGVTRPQPLFSTELLALQALRYEIELRSAHVLMGIDKRIAECREEKENSVSTSDSVVE